MRRLNVQQFSRNLTIHVVLYGPPYPGKDINGKIVPYLAGKTSTFLLSEAL